VGPEGPSYDPTGLGAGKGETVGHEFMSPSWCDEVLRSSNANEKIYRGFKDAKAFTNKMEWRTKDSPLVTHMEWEEGRMVYFGPPKFDEPDLWIILEASIEAWRAAADGEADGARLLMGGRLKMAKGPISGAIENAGAFNEFLRNWGTIDTDWPS